MAEKKFTVHVVPETHWDREWHTPFQGFRRRLVKLTDKLLQILDNDPEFRYFVFDGQTVVLEDHLEIRPEDRERLGNHIRSGRLQIGPWYVLPDEWLVSGEALIRNLLLGHLIAESFGRVMKAGYIPDPFGHISQLPQLLAGFGIDSALFMRGIGEDEWQAAGEKTEFWWEAPDGTRVLAVHLKNTYCNAVNLGYEGGLWEENPRLNLPLAVEKARHQLDTLAPFATTRHILFNNGCDHVEPQPELPQILAHLNSVFTEAEFIHSNYEDYVKAVRATSPNLRTVRGEFHAGKFQLLLSGVFSSRMNLKLANERCEALLEKFAEPLQALAWLTGKRYESAFLWQAWRMVLQNHPHDSICGCSVDQVHREMLPRFDQAEQIANIMADEALATLARQVGVKATHQDATASQARKIVVFNPSSWRRKELVRLRMALPLPPHQLPPTMVVHDSEGRIVPAQVWVSQVGEYDSTAAIPREQMKWEFELAFLADVPPLALKAYAAAPGQPGNIASTLIAGDNYIANELIHVTVGDDGAVCLIDKSDGQQFGPLNIFEDQEDAGDEYDWSYAPSGRVVTSIGQPVQVSLAERGPARAMLRIDRSLRLPASLSPDRQRRSEEIVDVPITTYLWVTPGSPRLDFETIVENRAKDHRLRVLFYTDISVDTCHAQGHFDVIERFLSIPSGEGWVQKPQATKCTKGFVDIADGQKGLGVVVFGLPEYEVKPTPGGTAVAVTLLRCVGWLSRDDYPTRPCNAGPKLPTPDAQCQGRSVFRYGVVPHKGTWLDADLWHHAEAVRAPLKAWQTPLAVEDEEVVGERSFLSVEPHTMVVTAMKKAERSADLVVRLLNLTDTKDEARLTFHRPVVKACLANLNEEPLQELKPDGTTVVVAARGKQLVTLLIKLG